MDVVLVAFIAEVKVVADRALVTRAIGSSPCGTHRMCTGVRWDSLPAQETGIER